MTDVTHPVSGGSTCLSWWRGKHYPEGKLKQPSSLLFSPQLFPQLFLWLNSKEKKKIHQSSKRGVEKVALRCYQQIKHIQKIWNQYSVLSYDDCTFLSVSLSLSPLWLFFFSVLQWHAEMTWFSGEEILFLSLNHASDTEVWRGVLQQRVLRTSCSCWGGVTVRGNGYASSFDSISMTTMCYYFYYY